MLLGISWCSCLELGDPNQHSTWGNAALAVSVPVVAPGPLCTSAMGQGWMLALLGYRVCAL